MAEIEKPDYPEGGGKKVLSSKQLGQVTSGNQCKQVGSGRWVWSLWRLLLLPALLHDPDPSPGSPKATFGTL